MDSKQPIAGGDVTKRSSITEAIRHVETSEALDVEQEYAEIALKSLISEDTLRDIPFVRTVVAGFSILSSVRDYSLRRKLKEFLEGVAGVTQWQRADMVSRLEADPAYNRKVGLHVIELLDRMDSHRKPAMIGRVFAAYALGRIDVSALQRLVVSIERLAPHDIGVVRKVDNAIRNNRQELVNINSESIYAMINAGLAYAESGLSGGGLKVTPTCSAFLELNLDSESAR